MIKKSSIYIFLAIMIFFYSCKTSTGENNEETNKINTEEIITTVTTVDSDTSGFIQKNAFSISDIQQPNDASSSMGDVSICEEFKLLTAAEITTIIQEATPMTGVELHHLFDHLPCNITANIKQGEETYNLDINSGAWFYISTNDTTYTYGNYDEKLDKYFMSSVMTEEEIHGE